MILRYDSFLENLILDHINEAILYYSPDLKKVLTNIKDSEIAQELINAEATEVKPDTTFIDLDKEGYLSFITTANALKVIDTKWPEGSIAPILRDKPNKRLAELVWGACDNDPDGISSKSRNLIKVGKLVNKLFPDKYKDKDIEEFVNKFKASIENSKERFLVVEGNDIDYWYDHNRYYEISGTLGNSCMRGKSGTGYFDIYTKNPEVCRMLILIENDKLKGRALVWKVSNSSNNLDFTYFLDRQYTINDSDVIKFRKYAEENDWAYKTYNNNSDLSEVTYKGVNKSIRMNIKLKHADEDKKSFRYKKYPYLDTFRRYDPDLGILYNDSNQESDYAGHYILEDTGGGYIEIQGGKWSEYYGEYIDEDSAVWSVPMDSYLDINQSVEINRGYRRHRGWWPRDHDEVLYDEYVGDHIHADDSIFSSVYGYDILEEDSINVIRIIRKNLSIETGSVYDNDNNYLGIMNYDDEIWYKKLCQINQYEMESVSGILDDCLVKYSDNKWIPDNLSIDVFELLSDEYDIDYLTELDAYILGVRIDKKSTKIVDMISYDTKLYKTRNLFKILKSKASSIINKNQSTLFDDEIESDPNLKSAVDARYRSVSNRLDQLEDLTYVYED
jgi:hypothetical protein